MRPRVGQLINQSSIGFRSAQLVQGEGWYEVDGYKEHFRQDDIQAVRMFRVPWNQRADFINQFLGYSYSTALVAIGAGGGAVAPGGIKRVLPAQHPERPYLYCDAVELVKGEGAIRNNAAVFVTDGNGNIVVDKQGNPTPVPMIEYFDQSGAGPGFGLYAVRYTARDYEIRPDEEIAGVELPRWVTRIPKISAQTLPLPGKGIAFLNGPYATDPPTIISDPGQGIVVPIIDWEYTWYDVPDVPYAGIFDCVGKLNAFDFDGVRTGYPKLPNRTLLCMTPTFQRFRSPTGRVLWNIKYHFIQRTNSTWQQFPAPDGHYYDVQRVLIDGTANGIPVYGIADFDKLFIAPPPAEYQ
jgi:hypothetical protein